jgi:hypothetical protein
LLSNILSFLFPDSYCFSFTLSLSHSVSRIPLAARSFIMSHPSTPNKEAQVTLSPQSGARNVDAAWKFLDQNRDAAGASEAVHIDKMRRKIDWHIVPLMFCCYTMQFLDKVILNVSV